MNTLNAKKTIIVSAFPCCGKSYAFENYQDKYSILDSDSSKFSWIERKRTPEELEAIKKSWDSELHLLSGEGYINKIKDDIIKVRNPNFINDYIKHIKENIGKVDFIFVSSHLEVRQVLMDEDIKYITVYPSHDMLNEWVGRMYLRGSNKTFIDFQIEHWDDFTQNIVNEPHGIHLCRLGHHVSCSYNPIYMDINFIEHLKAWYEYLTEHVLINDKEGWKKYDEK